MYAATLSKNSPYGIMLTFLCFFVLFNAVYGEKFSYLTYQDKIKNLEGYIFEKFFTTKNFGMNIRFSHNKRFAM